MNELRDFIILMIADFAATNNPDQLVMKFTTAMTYLSMM